MPSPVHPDNPSRTLKESAAPASAQQEQRPRNPNYKIPRGFEKLLHQDPKMSAPTTHRKEPTQRRYHLHVRQQPTAARACGAAVRDRRPVDPPPIVQVLLSDFDPESSDDCDILQDLRFTVGCLLFPISDSSSRPQSPKPEKYSHPERSRESDGVSRANDTDIIPLLFGNAFVSPFHVDEDPDPNSAPTHPSSHDTNPGSSNVSKLHQPATFFIFADLSIRSAGLYRLKFRLMNWGSVEDTGQSMPILAEAWSDSFRVYPAKDFPGMRDSSILANGLKELGFAELKIRGKGKGKGRRK